MVSPGSDRPEDTAGNLRLLVDTGAAIHKPQTERIAGRRSARSIHGYFGMVVTRKVAAKSTTPLCVRCFPNGVIEP